MAASTTHWIRSRSIIADSGFPVCHGEKGIIEADLCSDTAFSDAIRAFDGGSASNMQDHYGSGLNINYEDEASGRLTSVGSLCGLDAEHKPWLHVNIRYSITADADALLEQMTEVCRKHGFSLRLLPHSRPNHFPLEHPVVKRLTDIYNQLSGDHAEPFVMGGGTYARMLPRAFAYGMGLPGD